MSTPNPYAPPQATVSDAPRSTQQSELAGRARRLGAALLDGAAVSIPVAIAAGLVFVTRTTADDADRTRNIAIGAGALVYLIMLIIQMILLHRSGQTIGKLALSIKIVRSSGERASLGRIVFLRVLVGSFIGAIPYLGTLYAFIDMLMIFSDSRQCVHDRIADTIVVEA
jgi:uncharacterized RDD family membrane protein YckC